MTIGDARKQREPCPGRDRCDDVQRLYEAEYRTSGGMSDDEIEQALSDAIVATCKACPKEVKASKS